MTRNTTPRRLPCLLALLGLLLPATVLHATVTSVTVTPASTTATLGANNQLLLTWHVASNLNSPIRSTAGAFTSPDGSIVLGVSPQLLAGNTPPSPASLNEALAIPGPVLQAAANQGLGTILYTRTFTDDDGPAGQAAGSVVITVVVPALSQASAIPNRFPATLQTGGRINTVWTVGTTVAGLPVRSNSGQFLLTPDGPVLATVARPLSATSAGTVAQLPESLQVPASVVYQALAAGNGVFYYHRHFDAVPATTGADAMVEIRIGGSTSGPLALSRLSLRFSDGSLRRIVGADHPLRALAEVNYTGTGLLQAVWEVAAPPSTSGAFVFQPLRLVRQYLLPGGHVVLESPPLPVNMQGRYVVRLRLQSPQLDSGPVALEYSVNPAIRGGGPILRPLPLRSPDDDVRLDAATRFAWQPVAQARAYQLEFYAVDARPDTQPPRSGLLVPSTTTDLLLSTLARAHLESGRSYRWRVLAIDASGRVIARSDLREVRVP